MKNVAVRFGVYGSAVGDSQLLSAANALSTAGAQGQSQMLSAARTQVQNVIMWSNIASDTDYVTALYLSYLQRFPDADGLNAWVSEVPTIGRDSVRDGFAYSDEFAARVSNLRGTAASDTERTDAFVQYVYNGILHRSANGSEDATAISTLDNAGATGQANVIAAANDLARNLFNSSEYTSRSGLTPHDFVYDLYQTLYCSPPDNSWDYWTDQVGANWENKQAVLDHFINAGPFDQKAATLYREVLWLVPDQLGTPRMIAERTGSLAGIKRHDYLPFGEELFASTGGRTTAQGYVGDSTRQHFTGYERDLESGLDYAHARYYSSTQGRFTSADIPLMDQYKTNPQSWNLYTYVGNKPLTYTDPFGLWKPAQCENGVCWEAEKGDTYAGLAKILGVSAKALAKNFQNEKITVGHIFDVSGFFATNTPVAQTPRTYLEVIIWYPQPSAHHPLSLGHVSYNINGQSWSWERNGWHRDSAENFLKQNSYRDGRGYVLDDENDPSWAAEMADNIMSFHGDGNSLLPGLGPYGLIHDNCGEAFCRAANKMGLPQNDGVLPTDHASYILNKMRPYIKSINFYRHGAVESRPVRR
jgi:RHS repeat-associated protein